MTDCLDENKDDSEKNRDVLSVIDSLKDWFGLSAATVKGVADLAALEAKISLIAIIQYYVLVNALALLAVLVWLGVLLLGVWWVAVNVHWLAGVFVFLLGNAFLALMLIFKIRSLHNAIGFSRSLKVVQEIKR